MYHISPLSELWLQIASVTFQWTNSRGRRWPTASLGTFTCWPRIIWSTYCRYHNLSLGQAELPECYKMLLFQFKKKWKRICNHAWTILMLYPLILLEEYSIKWWKRSSMMASLTGWGKIVTIFTFEGILIKKLLREWIVPDVDTYKEISYFVAEFITKNTGEWIR